MKSAWVFLAFVLPLLFGGTACGHGAKDRGVIVKVKSPDERDGYLGVSIQDMTRRLARSMEVKTDEGALVNDVTEDSPADDAGIKNEDIIVDLDGGKITNADDLRESVRKTKPGTKVNVVVMRKDERKTLTATIGKAPRSRSFSYSFTPHAIPRIPRGPMNIHIFKSISHVGMTLSTLNKQLGKYFETPDGKGVLVQEVEEESNAAKAGLQAGDVIIKVGEETIRDVEDVTDALEDHKEGDKVNIEVMRKGTRKTFALEVPDLDRRHREWGFAPDGDSWNEFDINIDPPDVEMELDGHGSLKRDLRKLELELHDLGREIQSRARQWQQELKAKLNGVVACHSEARCFVSG